MSIIHENKKLLTSPCNTTVKPKEKKALPTTSFVFDSWANQHINNFQIEISYYEVYKKPRMTKKDNSIIGIIPVNTNLSIKKKVFISHSNEPKDNLYLNILTQALRRVGFTLYIAEHNPQLGSNLWGKILTGISESDLFIVLYTENGALSLSQFMKRSVLHLKQARK